MTKVFHCACTLLQLIAFSQPVVPSWWVEYKKEKKFFFDLEIQNQSQFYSSCSSRVFPWNRNCKIHLWFKVYLKCIISSHLWNKYCTYPKTFDSFGIKWAMKIDAFITKSTTTAFFWQNFLHTTLSHRHLTLRLLL